MEILDLKKQLKAYYQPSAKQPEIIQIPAFQFLMLDGVIEPGMEPGNSPAFHEAMQVLYGAAYTIKFMLKRRKENPVDFPVMALEGLWWVEDGAFDLNRKDNWSWTLMILQPSLVTQAVFQDALVQMRKKSGDLPVLSRLRLETFEEGLCVQMMHIGPYAAEPETLARMHAFAEQQGYRLRLGRGGKHHEIYMGDPRRSAPEKLKTVLRHPIER